MQCLSDKTTFARVCDQMRPVRVKLTEEQIASLMEDAKKRFSSMDKHEAAYQTSLAIHRLKERIAYA